MQKKLFDGFFRQIQRIDIRSCYGSQLVALSHLYDHVHTLVSVMPCLVRDYGGRPGIAKRAKAIADILIARMEEGTSVEQEMQYLEVLIDYFNRYMDREREDRVLERARLLLKKYIPAPGQEAGFCQLICDCYYMVQKKNLATRAERMIARWCMQQTDAGDWPGLSPEIAIKRLEVMHAYHTYMLNLDFDAFQQRGIDYYLHDFTEYGAGLTAEQLSLYLQKAGLLLFVNNPRAEREQIEQMGNIFEQYLKENYPLAMDNVSSPDRKNKERVSGKDFPEPALKIMSVLASCLLEQEAWKCEERAASLII